MMDRRFDQRFPSDSQVVVTDIDSQSESCTGTLLDMSVSGICVQLPVSKPSGTLVKLEFADTVLYGQVAYSQEENGSQEKPGGFRTGVSVERVLFNASDLSNILESLIGEAEPSAAPVPASKSER